MKLLEYMNKMRHNLILTIHPDDNVKEYDVSNGKIYKSKKYILNMHDAIYVQDVPYCGKGPYGAGNTILEAINDMTERISGVTIKYQYVERNEDMEGNYDEGRYDVGYKIETIPELEKETELKLE